MILLADYIDGRLGHLQAKNMTLEVETDFDVDTEKTSNRNYIE